MRSEIVPYGGWDECVRLSNGMVELIVTKLVGPRIIRYGFIGGPNEFVEYDDQMGRTGGRTYRSYGGHRLWVAPETRGWTDHPDNDPVDCTKENGDAVFAAPIESGTGIQKSIAISLSDTGTHACIRHTIRNTTDEPIRCALWALTVMAPGGTAIIPQEPFIPHQDKVLPARSMALWHYADMEDPRWTWGRKFIRLRQSSDLPTPQKFGAMTTAGWSAYARDSRLFVKKFPFDPEAIYPDFGCNAEVFTNRKMLEVESLGPLAPLAPGETRDHTEEWSLAADVNIPPGEDALERVLAPLLPSR